jgi:hypothetical protein
MGYTRQGVAIGLSMLALVAVGRSENFKFFICISLAATFHKSAVILVPLALFSGNERKFGTIFAVILTGSLAYLLFLQESVGRLISGYVVDEMESSGALVRVLMNAVPAGLFLLARRYFIMDDRARKFWTWMAVGAILFIPAFFFSPSSTAVDRIALYWIPIQVFVWSRFPRAICVGRRSMILTQHAVIFYSFSVLFVWLTFGAHAHSWLPYKFFPLVLLLGTLFPF